MHGQTKELAQCNAPKPGGNQGRWAKWKKHRATERPVLLAAWQPTLGSNCFEFLGLRFREGARAGSTATLLVKSNKLTPSQRGAARRRCCQSRGRACRRWTAGRGWGPWPTAAGGWVGRAAAGRIRRQAGRAVMRQAAAGAGSQDALADTLLPSAKHAAACQLTLSPVRISGRPGVG